MPVAQRLPPASAATPPPMVAPVEIIAIAPDRARAINAAVSFSTAPNPAASPFLFAGGPADLERATDCLAAAQYYEAGDDDVGQRAVAQVVLNRVRHPAFPKTVCGVVFQGSERRTGCQFTFSCDGALTRTPSDAAWTRARTVAHAALTGRVERQVGYATHYHTDWVVPYWSVSLDKITAVGTHLFYRWAGWWGTPPAFRRTVSHEEPAVASIAFLSPAHATAAGAQVPLPGPPTIALTGAIAMAAAPAIPIGADTLGKRLGGARLVAVDPALTSFIIALDKGAAPDSYPMLARTYCSGRQRCRILAWIDDAATPGGFPLSGDQLAAMRFSYIHDAPSGLQRALWNCAAVPRGSPAECMRRRETTTVAPVQPAPIDSTKLPPVLDGVRRKRYEQVTITPQTTVAPSDHLP